LTKTSRKPRQGASVPARSNPAPPTSAEGDPSAPAEPPGSLLTDPASVPRWLEASRAALLDLLAAAREGARRPRKRVLSRAEIRRQARDAFAHATALLDLAAEALRTAGSNPPP
jgi:hypothetical protein